MAYALQGEPGLARRSYAASVAAYLASDLHLFALMRKREELILAVLPYQADDLAERELVAAAAERTARWVVEHGGHVNPNLPRYARVPLLVLEGRWREARGFSRNKIYRTFRTSRACAPCTLGRSPGRRGMPRQRGGACTRRRRFVPRASPASWWVKCRSSSSFLRRGSRSTPGTTIPRGWLDLHRRWLDFMEATLGRVEGEVLEAEWHRAAGEADRALDHAERALAHATTPRQPLALLAAHRILGILATDAGRTSDAEHHFAEALALADACRAPYERALTLLARADLAVAQGDRTTATMQACAPSAPRWTRVPLAHAERIAASLPLDGGAGGARMAILRA